MNSTLCVITHKPSSNRSKISHRLLTDEHSKQLHRRGTLYLAKASQNMEQHIGLGRYQPAKHDKHDIKGPYKIVEASTSKLRASINTKWWWFTYLPSIQEAAAKPRQDNNASSSSLKSIIARVHKYSSAHK